MKLSWTCDEEGMTCGQCGQDVYHCSCDTSEDKLAKILNLSSQDYVMTLSGLQRN